MKGLALLLWQVYGLQDCQEDHPIRRAVAALTESERRIEKLEGEVAQMLALARENGQLRDVARRERDAAVALLREARASLEQWCEQHDLMPDDDIALFVKIDMLLREEGT